MSDLFPVAILAGGLGTRLGTLTTNRPKALVDVCGEPFIAHQLRSLAEQNVTRMVICAGHLGGMIFDAIGDGSKYGVEISYSFDGATLLGTAGALRKALPLLGYTFFVLYGDSLLRCNYATIQESFVRSKRLSLMTVTSPPNERYGPNAVYVNGRISYYSNRRHDLNYNRIDYGLGILTADAIDLIPPWIKWCDLSDLYTVLAMSGELAGYDVPDRFYEIGSKKGLVETRELLKA